MPGNNSSAVGTLVEPDATERNLPETNILLRRLATQARLDARQYSIRTELSTGHMSV